MGDKTSYFDEYLESSQAVFWETTENDLQLVDCKMEWMFFKVKLYSVCAESRQWEMEILKCNNASIEKSDERKPVYSYLVLRSFCGLTFQARLAGSSCTMLGAALTEIALLQS